MNTSEIGKSAQNNNGSGQPLDLPESVLEDRSHSTEGSHTTKTIHFDAAPIPPEVLEEKFINNITAGAGGTNRRIAFAFLSRSSGHYYENARDEETGESFLDAVQCLRGYIKDIETHLEMMQAAEARMWAVLGHNFEEGCDHD